MNRKDNIKHYIRHLKNYKERLKIYKANENTLENIKGIEVIDGVAYINSLNNLKNKLKNEGKKLELINSDGLAKIMYLIYIMIAVLVVSLIFLLIYFMKG